MGKAREFWIKVVTNDRDAFVIPFEVDNKKVLVDPRCIHVIEKSAYQKAVDALKEIKKWEFSTDGRKFNGNHKEVLKQVMSLVNESLKELGELS